MVGLEIRPIAKLYYQRTESLPTDGKGGRRGEKYFFAPRCNRHGESKRERTRECLQLYAPLIDENDCFLKERLGRVDDRLCSETTPEDRLRDIL